MTRRALGVITLATMLATAHHPVAAQSEGDARRETEQLRARVELLQGSLDAAQERIAELEAQLENMRQLLATTRRGAAGPAKSPPTDPPAGPPTAPATTAPATSIDESIPNASPRALLDALKDSYREATEDLIIGEAGDRQRIVYLRGLDRWASRVNRELKSQIQWHVRIMRPRPGSQQRRLELQAVDPKTDRHLGDPFQVVASINLLRRLRVFAERDQLEVLVLRGVVRPHVTINLGRQQKGAFDKPRFIGPFAEFQMTVDVSSLTQATEEVPRGRRVREEP